MDHFLVKDRTHFGCIAFSIRIKTTGHICFHGMVGFIHHYAWQHYNVITRWSFWCHQLLDLIFFFPVVKAFWAKQKLLPMLKTNCMRPIVATIAALSSKHCNVPPRYSHSCPRFHTVLSCCTIARRKVFLNFWWCPLCTFLPWRFDQRFACAYQSVLLFCRL